MKRILYFTACLAVAFSAVSCEDFFDRVPGDKFAANAFFTSENDLALYTNGLINSGMPGFTSITLGEDIYTDYCATRESKQFYYEGQWGPGNASGWAYGDFGFLRQVAYMLENMENAKDNVNPDIYNHYEGVARFWRAYATFNKVKNFSDCYFIDHVISPADSTLLYGPRQDREYVVGKIVEDLEFATANCLTTGSNINSDGRVYVNKYVALAMASRICLYEGTFRKYHDVNPSTGKPWTNEHNTAEELLQKAFDWSKELIDINAFGLVKDFRSLFVSANLPKEEVIWGRSGSLELNVLHNTTNKYCSATTGIQYSPTKDYVRLFLGEDGKPVTANLSVAKEFDKRDKRLSATVLAPGQKKDKNGEKLNFDPNFTWSKTGYNWMKWLIMEEDVITSTTNASYNSVPIIRYAEVLLNHAEAAEELGKLDKTIWDATIGKLRERGGVKSIFPGDGGYVEDMELKDYYTRGLAHATVLSNAQLEIRRERATELMLEGNSHYDDLMRWNIGDIIERRYNGNAWRGIYLTTDDVKNGWTFNGVKYTVSTSKDTGAQNYKLTSDAPQGFTLSKGDYGFLLYHYPVTWDDKMYTKPIPTTAINVNPNLGQNEGWQWM